MGAIVVSGNLLATSHGILIDSASQLSNASRAGVRVTASKFLGGISNAGSISAITGIDVSRATTFTGGISNGGTITAVTGIAVGFNNGTPGKVTCRRHRQQRHYLGKRGTEYKSVSPTSRV